MSWLFICNICFHISITISFPITSKTFKLTPNTVSSANDISVTLGSGATVISNLWSINVNSQRGTDLTLHLGSSWGFNPNIQSRIDLTINGNTSNETYHDDGEILLVFNVEDQYFAEMISIDSRRIAYRECPASNTPLITTNTTKVIHSKDPDNRYNRFCNNTIETIDKWQIAQHPSTGSNYKEAAQWPLYMSITNDPIADTVAYSWTDKSNPSDTILSSQYTSSFNTNKGIDIHISGENSEEDFFIFSVDIMYHFFGTETPTVIPTTSPTDPPTSIKPTTSAPTTSLLPTLAPIVATTDAPATQITTTSLRPSSNAPTTQIPTTTNAPTVIPTIAPTNAVISTTIATDYTTISTVDDVISTSIAASELTSVNITNSMMTEAQLEVTLPKSTVVVADETTVNDTIDDGHNEQKTMMDRIPKRTWYAVAVCGFVCMCVLCAVLFWGLKKLQHHEVAAKDDYKGVPIAPCKDDDAVEIHIPKDGDKSGHAQHHSYKSSNDTFEHHRFHHSNDFSNHLSSAVTGDEILMDEIHHRMETDGHYAEHRRSNTSDDDVLDDESTSSDINTAGAYAHKSTEANRTHNMTHNEVHKGKYSYDGQYEYNINRHHYHGYNAEEQRSSEDHIHGQYEIGMVTMSKISEMAPQSKGSAYRKEAETIGDLASLAKKPKKHKINNDSLAMEGDELNDDYDDLSSDELLKMETAGFIDGDYNEIEYEDEYYEDDD